MTALAIQVTLEANARIENIQEFLSVTKSFDEKEAEEEETGLGETGTSSMTWP